ncbi:hypothetical protein ACFLRI_03065 [Bacteroidota bacterium]
MKYLSKIIVSIFNFFILLWLLFVLQRVMKIGVEVKYLNVGVALLTSAILTYITWKQQLNFNTILKYSGIFWVIGFILGITYISIFDPHDGQGIFLSILWTAPIGWLLGMTISVFKAKMSLSRNN